MEVLRNLRLLVFLLVAGASVVGAGAVQRKQKPRLSLSEKVQNLQIISAKRPLLRFNGQKFREYVKNPPRNYSMIILLGALSPSHQCQICREAYDEFAIVANSYHRLEPVPNKLFFAFVDYDESFDVFQMLNVNAAPVIIHFPAKGKLKGADTMALPSVGIGAAAIARFVSERTDVQIRIIRPPDHSAIAALVTLVAVAGGFLYIRRNNLDFLYSRQIWGALAITFSLVMTSGHMYNRIKDIPLVGRAENGHMVFMHNNTNNQVALESFIMLLLYGMFAASMILFTDSAVQTDKRKAFIMVVVGLGLINISYALILLMVRTKWNPYPFSFLFN